MVIHSFFYALVITRNSLGYEVIMLAVTFPTTLSSSMAENILEGDKLDFLFKMGIIMV
jgi:hypothetical protein